MEPVGKRMILLMFLLCGQVISLVASHDQSHCKMEDFQVKKNFDEDRFQGKWYEVSWVTPPWLQPELNYFDYVQNNTKTNYGFSILGVGRWPFNATECLEPQYSELYRTGENAKYLYTAETPEGLVNLTYWVVDTDYDNYALAIGCRDVAPNGTCLVPDGGMWTRCQNKPTRYVELMKKRLADFCLTVDEFDTTHQNMECMPDIPASCRAGAVGAVVRTQAALVTASILGLLVFIILH